MKNYFFKFGSIFNTFISFSSVPKLKITCSIQVYSIFYMMRMNSDRDLNFILHIHDIVAWPMVISSHISVPLSRSIHSLRHSKLMIGMVEYFSGIWSPYSIQLVRNLYNAHSLVFPGSLNLDSERLQFPSSDT